MAGFGVVLFLAFAARNRASPDSHFDLSSPSVFWTAAFFIASCSVCLSHPSPHSITPLTPTSLALTHLFVCVVCVFGRLRPARKATKPHRNILTNRPTNMKYTHSDKHRYTDEQTHIQSMTILTLHSTHLYRDIQTNCISQILTN